MKNLAAVAATCVVLLLEYAPVIRAGRAHFPTLARLEGLNARKPRCSRALTSVSVEKVKYFAYGANMDPKVMKRRGVQLEDGSSIPGILRDHSLCFNHQGCYANIVPRSDSLAARINKFDEIIGQSPSDVHGVIYLLDPDDIKKLAKYEGGYVISKCRVEKYHHHDGGTMSTKGDLSNKPSQAGSGIFVDSVIVFQSSKWFALRRRGRVHGDRPSAMGLVPRERYKRVLCVGAKFHGLDRGYQEWLRALPTLSDEDFRDLGRYYYTANSLLTLVVFIGVGIAGFFTFLNS
mmetsp:Transcript_40934/g.65814  ORF Transcript_40934/g.65814 Transcript_40934/m.65814 type:complete len:290 (+) Transcript_40934:143-1012(+)|eukprot:jgi/Bigna1/143306/aug1.77_g18014